MYSFLLSACICVYKIKFGILRLLSMKIVLLNAESKYKFLSVTIFIHLYWYIFIKTNYWNKIEHYNITSMDLHCCFVYEKWCTCLSYVYVILLYCYIYNVWMSLCTISDFNKCILLCFLTTSNMLILYMLSHTHVYWITMNIIITFLLCYVLW